MFFVNRDQTTAQMLASHKRKFNRAKNGDGETWELPIVDNVFGLGKTRFGLEYIWRCRALRDDGKLIAYNDDFLDTLCSCHTIRIEFSPGELLDEDGQFVLSRAMRNFATRIGIFFINQYGASPCALAPECFSNSGDLLMNSLTREVGPLFIVIDETGKAFKHSNLDDISGKERFLTFCSYTLDPLFSNKNLFFLIAGRGRFLSYVGQRPSGNSGFTESPYEFVRLSLELLRPPAIKEIIENTYWKKSEMKTIKEHYNFDDDQVEKVAMHLFETTFGPRSLLDAFKTCPSDEDLMQYQAPDFPDDMGNWSDFGERLKHYKKPLRQIMECVLGNNAIDLSRTWEDGGGEIFSYDTIAFTFRIDWEGVMHEAKLYMSSFIQKMILTHVYTLEDVLQKAPPAIGKISIGYPDVFELFPGAIPGAFCGKYCLNKVLSAFFTDKQRFGGCDGVEFAQATYWMPKRSSEDIKWRSILLMHEIDKIWNKYERLNLKPFDVSVSPDILLLTKVRDTKLMVGLAVKYYSRTEVTEEMVKAECDKFDRMCSSSDDSNNRVTF